MVVVVVAVLVVLVNTSPAASPKTESSIEDCWEKTRCGDDNEGNLDEPETELTPLVELLGAAPSLFLLEPSPESEGKAAKYCIAWA